MHRIIYVMFIAGLLMSNMACQTTYQAGAPEGRIDVIAHRGASEYAPENTVASFRLANEMGADWFELDCSLSADNALIVMHDCSLKRTTGLDKPIRAASLEEIRTLDAGSWYGPEFAGEPVPTLGDALDFAKGRIGVYIEVKGCTNDDLLHAQLMLAAGSQTTLTPALRSELMTLVTENGTDNLDLARAVIREVRAHDMAKQVVIQSFSPVVCLVTLSEAPELRTEMLASEDEDHPERWPMVVNFAKLIRTAGFNADADSLSEERIADFHANGMTVAAWTVDDPETMRSLAQWGVDSIITNKPDLARETLAGKDSPSSASPASL